MPDALTVFGAGSLAVLASACGALPLAVRRTREGSSIGRGGALAGGVMLAVSGGLALEGAERSIGIVAIGAAAGMLFVEVLRRVVARLGRLDAVSLAGAGGRSAVLIVTVLTVHSSAEALGLASSFAGNGTLGLTVALALAIHKLPEGLAVSLALVPRGVPLRTAAWVSALAAAPLPLLGVPAFLFVEAFHGLLAGALGFAAGAMILVVIGEMLPEAARRAPLRSVVAYGAIAFAVTVAFQAGVSVA